MALLSARSPLGAPDVLWPRFQGKPTHRALPSLRKYRQRTSEATVRTRAQLPRVSRTTHLGQSLQQGHWEGWRTQTAAPPRGVCLRAATEATSNVHSDAHLPDTTKPQAQGLSQGTSPTRSLPARTGARAGGRPRHSQLSSVPLGRVRAGPSSRRRKGCVAVQEV